MVHFRAVLDPARFAKFVDTVFAQDDYNIAAYTPAVGNEVRPGPPPLAAPSAGLPSFLAARDNYA